MAKRLQYRRLLLLALLLLAVFGGLGYRLVDLQVLQHDDLIVLAQQNTRREFLREPRRGDILDCKGNILASSVFVKTVCADPTLLGNYQPEVARALAPLLGMNESELGRLLLPQARQNDKGETVTNRFVRLKTKVPVETWDKIQAVMKDLPLGLEGKKLTSKEREFFAALRQKAVFARHDQMRDYPNEALAAHVLGYAQTEESIFNGMPVSEIVGRDGIELMLNSRLSGIRGWRLTETDLRGREMVAMRGQDMEPQDGRNVVLTIDLVIQHFLESALAEAMEKHTPISISGIAVRPRTGEILALATLPSYNPKNPGKDADARRNRVVTDVMEPGSTFKIVAVSGALSDQIVRLDDVFDCEHGRFGFAGKVLHDHGSYGTLSVRNIITKSSNIGAAKIGIKMGQSRLYDYLGAYGFGELTGIMLPAESRGIVPRLKNWSKVSIAQVPMGHGVAVTRLQMIMAMSAIANRGQLMRPMLVSRLEDQEGNVVARYSPQPMRQVITEAAARQMVEALKTVVTPEGTAPKAAMENYTVAGKTGTAQKVENGTYAHDKFFASFIGFFPADNPEICISIVLDEPKQGYYGGSVAGPVFKQIAERAASYLNIRPDNPGPATPNAPALAGKRPARTVALAE